MNYYHYLPGRKSLCRALLSTFLCPFLFLFLGLSSGYAQEVSGKVLDDANGTPLVGARISLLGTTSGALTQTDGSFTLRLRGSAPYSIQVTYYGRDTIRRELDGPAQGLTFRLAEGSVDLDEVEIVASALAERQRQEPLSVESMSINAIKETPAADFYDGLGALKGVDLTAASIGFKVINTRGFNSSAPVRSLQIIDGVDNQAPGLNFSLGNFLGASELDVEQVDLIVGASSAYYGPNAFNGVISMKTKSPFIHQGLSFRGKVAERSLGEVALRYAKGFSKQKWARPFCLQNQRLLPDSERLGSG